MHRAQGSSTAARLGSAGTEICRPDFSPAAAPPPPPLVWRLGLVAATAGEGDEGGGDGVLGLLVGSGRGRGGYRRRGVAALGLAVEAGADEGEQEEQVGLEWGVREGKGGRVTAAFWARSCEWGNERGCGSRQ